MAKKSNEFKRLLKLEEHLQDATPLTLGQEFSGYHTQLKKCIIRIEAALKEIYYLAQGGKSLALGSILEKISIRKLSEKYVKLQNFHLNPLQINLHL